MKDMTITKYPANNSTTNVKATKANVSATLARLVKENAMYRETMRQIADRTAFAADDITTVGWIHKAATNALNSVNQTNGALK